MRWLLLLHQIPPSPAYFRAKVLRRMSDLGALAVKNSAYLLPAGEDTMEDFEWLRREIADNGGEAWLFRVNAVAGLTDPEIEESFRTLRAPDLAELEKDAREVMKAGPEESEWRRLTKRYDDIRRIDYFGAPGRDKVDKTMNIIDTMLHGPQPKKKAGKEYSGRVWVTRAGVKVDRIASVWLIRRFIDPAAQFKFVDPNAFNHVLGELRFDMFSGEFTHRGDLCTFEVLLELAPGSDRALEAIGQIVHEIDLKDTRFARPETAGIAGLIEGIVMRHSDDHKRIEEGTMLFESLYARLRAAC